MATAAEFVKTGITGHTFREVTEKFGKPIDQIGNEDRVMSLYALAFAWFREREQMPVQTAYEHVMKLTPKQVEDLFEDDGDVRVAAAADFESQPQKTTP